MELLATMSLRNQQRQGLPFEPILNEDSMLLAISNVTIKEQKAVLPPINDGMMGVHLKTHGACMTLRYPLLPDQLYATLCGP